MSEKASAPVIPIQDESEKPRSRAASTKSIDRPQKSRPETKVGRPGYVSSVLDQVLSGENLQPILTDDGEKPIRQQSRLERQITIAGSETDTAKHFSKENLTRRKSVRSKKSASLISSSEQKEESSEYPKYEDSRTQIPMTSEWTPRGISSELQLAKRSYMKVQRSWVGSYIVGKDYWSAEEMGIDRDPSLVNFSMDQQLTWYDMPLSESSLEESYQKRKSDSLQEMQALKITASVSDDSYAEWRTQRLRSAAVARRGDAPKEWSNEIREAFHFEAISTSSTSDTDRLSMASADAWLENAGIVDRSRLTFVHTGFCFLAAGGNKYRGLTFDQFTEYLKLVSRSGRMPLADLVRRLVAFQRTGSTDSSSD